MGRSVINPNATPANFVIGWDGKSYPVRVGLYLSIVIYGRDTRVVHRQRVGARPNLPKLMKEFLTHHKIKGYEVDHEGTAFDTASGCVLKFEADPR